MKFWHALEGENLKFPTFLGILRHLSWLSLWINLKAYQPWVLPPDTSHFRGYHSFQYCLSQYMKWMRLIFGKMSTREKFLFFSQDFHWVIQIWLYFTIFTKLRWIRLASWFYFSLSNFDQNWAFSQNNLFTPWPGK